MPENKDTTKVRQAAAPEPAGDPDAARMLRHGRNVDLGYAVDAERGDGTARRDAGRKIREPAAVEHMVGRECDHLPLSHFVNDGRGWEQSVSLRSSFAAAGELRADVLILLKIPRFEHLAPIERG